LRILNAEYAEQPDDPFTLFNLGSVYHELQDPAAALAPLERSLALSDPRDSIVRKLYALIAQCRREMNQPAEALEVCTRGRAVYPDDEELLFLEAIVRRDRRDFAGAEACLKRLVGGPGEGNHFASVAEGLRGHKARHNLAVLYLDTGRPADAAAEWARVVADRPDFLPGHAGLAEAALQARHWDELEARVTALEALGPDGEQVAEALRGRGKLERGEYASARWALGRAVRKFPHSVQLRSLLSQAALREGAEGPAEEALLSVLELAPDHPEARFNLALLRAQRQLKPGEEVTLSGIYRAACAARPDGGGPLPGLYGLARQCPHVTVIGIDAPDVATAVLCAQPARVVWYGRTHPPEFDLLERLAKRTAFEFRPAEAATGRLDPTDLLVVAVGTDAGPTRRELRDHARLVRRFVALLGTPGTGGPPEENGLRAAADELIGTGEFRPAGAAEGPAGLTVLERVARPN
jgi:tetratricopeptide (TPR) repeat protein